MKPVNWTTIIDSDTRSVVDFVEGNLNLRNFKKNLKDDEAKKEARELERVYGTTKSRELARRALRRRAVNYSLTS